MNSHKKLVFKLTCLVILAFTTTLSAQAEGYKTKGAFSGIAKVVDGDGVKIANIEVRLQGISAPEKNQGPNDIGKKSTQNLRDLVQNRYVVCHLDGTKASSGRPVGVCFFNLQDIGQYQIETGHARDCQKFSNGRYSHIEQMAIDQGKNLSAIYELPAYCAK